jgi:hypothetical protein
MVENIVVLRCTVDLVPVIGPNDISRRPLQVVISYSPVLLSDGSEPVPSTHVLILVAFKINLDDGSSVTLGDDPFVAYFASVTRPR